MENGSGVGSPRRRQSPRWNSKSSQSHQHQQQPVASPRIVGRRRMTTEIHHQPSISSSLLLGYSSEHESTRHTKSETKNEFQKRQSTTPNLSKRIQSSLEDSNNGGLLSGDSLFSMFSPNAKQQQQPEESTTPTVVGSKQRVNNDKIVNSGSLKKQKLLLSTPKQQQKNKKEKEILSPAAVAGSSDSLLSSLRRRRQNKSDNRVQSLQKPTQSTGANSSFKRKRNITTTTPPLFEKPSALLLSPKQHKQQPDPESQTMTTPTSSSLGTLPLEQTSLSSLPYQNSMIHNTKKKKRKLTAEASDGMLAKTKNDKNDDDDEFYAVNHKKHLHHDDSGHLGKGDNNVAAKLLLDPTKDIRLLLQRRDEEFYSKFGGKGSKPIHPNMINYMLDSLKQVSDNVTNTIVEQAKQTKNVDPAQLRVALDNHCEKVLARVRHRLRTTKLPPRYVPVPDHWCLGNIKEKNEQRKLENEQSLKLLQKLRWKRQQLEDMLEAEQSRAVQLEARKIAMGKADQARMHPLLRYSLHMEEQEQKKERIQPLEDPPPDLYSLPSAPSHVMDQYLDAWVQEYQNESTQSNDGNVSKSFQSSNEEPQNKEGHSSSSSSSSSSVLSSFSSESGASDQEEHDHDE